MHPDEVLGDVFGVVHGGQPQILDVPPRALAKVEEAALHVHLLPKHGRHSMHRRHLKVGDNRGWVGVEAERLHALVTASNSWVYTASVFPGSKA